MKYLAVVVAILTTICIGVMIANAQDEKPSIESRVAKLEKAIEDIQKRLIELENKPQNKEIPKETKSSDSPWGTAKCERFWNDTQLRKPVLKVLVTYENTTKSTFTTYVEIQIVALDDKGSILAAEKKMHLVNPINPGYKTTFEVTLKAPDIEKCTKVECTVVGGN